MLAAQESNFRDAVVEAAGELCLTNAIVATDFVKTTKSVIFTAADSALRGRGESQVIALHALANVFGAERGEHEILDDEAEAILADAMFRRVRLKIFRRRRLHRLGEQERPFRQPSRRRPPPPVHRGRIARRFAEEIAAHPSARDALCARRRARPRRRARASPRARRPRRRRRRRRSLARPLSHRRRRVAAARRRSRRARRPGRPRVPSSVSVARRQTSNVKRQMSTPRESPDPRSTARVVSARRAPRRDAREPRGRQARARRR